MSETKDPIGQAWLMHAYNVRPIGRPPVLSQVGGRRSTAYVDGFRLETYPEAMRPAQHLIPNLQFHLRHEPPHLEFLARLFAATGPQPIQQWVEDEPTGQ